MSGWLEGLKFGLKSVYFNNRKNRLVRLINPATVRRKKSRLERRLSYIDSLTAVPFLTQASEATQCLE